MLFTYLLSFLSCVTPSNQHIEHLIKDGVKYTCICTEKEKSEPIMLAETNYIAYQESYECKCSNVIQSKEHATQVKHWGTYY